LSFSAAAAAAATTPSAAPYAVTQLSSRHLPRATSTQRVFATTRFADAAADILRPVLFISSIALPLSASSLSPLQIHFTSLPPLRSPRFVATYAEMPFILFFMLCRFLRHASCRLSSPCSPPFTTLDSLAEAISPRDFQPAARLPPISFSPHYARYHCHAAIASY